MIKALTPKQKRVLEIIYNTLEENSYSPSLADLRRALNVSSNQSVLNFLKSLEQKKLIKRNEGEARGITILPLGYKFLNKNPLAPFLGVSSAGPFVESLETLENWIPLKGKVLENEAVNQLKEDVFIIKVNGDSMINAEIYDGDILLVKKTNEFKSGDIVVARSDDGTTIKRFVAEPDGRAYLKPENPAYQNIPIFEETIFDGKVILNLSIIKNKYYE